MRITETEKTSIRDTFQEVFGEGEIYLFGSRVDDTVKGGDIDLFLIPRNSQDLLEKKLDFLVTLKEKIGDQKIDLVISRDKTRLIEKEAMEKGVKL